MPNEPINNVISPWMPEKDPIRLAVIGKLGEEAAELAQRCFRIVIQGFHENDPDSGRSNREELTREIADVSACIDTAIINGLASGDNTRKGFKMSGFARWHDMIREREYMQGLRDAELQDAVCRVLSKYGVADLYNAETEILGLIGNPAPSRKPCGCEARFQSCVQCDIRARS